MSDGLITLLTITCCVTMIGVTLVCISLSIAIFNYVFDIQERIIDLHMRVTNKKIMRTYNHFGQNCFDDDYQRQAQQLLNKHEKFKHLIKPLND